MMELPALVPNPCLMCAREEAEAERVGEVVRVSPCLQQSTVACLCRVFASDLFVFITLFISISIPSIHHTSPSKTPAL